MTLMRCYTKALTSGMSRRSSDTLVRVVEVARFDLRHHKTDSGYCVFARRADSKSVLTLLSHDVNTLKRLAYDSNLIAQPRIERRPLPPPSAHGA